MCLFLVGAGPNFPTAGKGIKDAAEKQHQGKKSFSPTDEARVAVLPLLPSPLAEGSTGPSWGQ